MLRPNNSVSQLHYSRIEDRNRFPNTDVLYEPLRHVLLRPNELTVSRPYINPAASHSRVTRDFAYLTETEVRELREKTLIPVDQPLVPTYNLDKVRNNKFMVVDAKESVIGAPITAEEMQRIRSQGLKEQRVVYDFGDTQVVQPVIPQPQPPTQIVKPAPIQQTKIIKQELKTTYRPPDIENYQPKNKYKYNLYSMLDQQVNGGGCGCPGNEIIASRNQPQSINWLN